MTAKKNKIGVGIIGLGARGAYCIGNTIAKLAAETDLIITAVCDRNEERLNEVVESFTLNYDEYKNDGSITRYTVANELIADENVDLIIIASPTDCHRPHALAALKSGKKVYCDKPLAQNVEDSIKIIKAESQNQNPMIMGFTRRYEIPWLEAYKLLKDGVIGELYMIQVRTVIPYWHYLMRWHRKRKWSGGALNDKGSHIFDVFNWFIESKVKSLHAFAGKKIIEADSSAPERCSICEKTDCQFRIRKTTDKGQDIMAHAGVSWINESERKYQDDVCVYNTDNDLYHSISSHFLYENGVIANYFYTIFGPHADDEETLELVGKRGRIILTRHTGMIDIVADQGKFHEQIDCKTESFSESHFGADLELIRELQNFYYGAKPTVSAVNGLEATRMVMGVFKSLDNNGKVINMSEIADARI